jgi:gliding motility-associated-like protein
VLSQSSCSASSNTVSIEESSITTTLNVSSTEVIIPGQTRTLTVTTNAINPTFQWYRNNIIINGATASTYVASQFGTYKVVVTQSQDCVATQEAIVNLIYPDSFIVTIAPNSNYSACFSDQTVLNITSFDALTTLGTLSILNNDYGYIYQWYKNGTLVVSSNQNTLPITSLTENGVYELRIVIPEVNLVISNTITITLGLPMTIEITPEFTAICENGGSTLLSSNVTDSNYVYRWYSLALDQQIGNQSQITISEAGDYYLEVEYNGCVYLSNTVTIQAIDETFITISEGDAFELFEGASVVVYATGGDSYQWFLGTEMVGMGSSYTVVQPGIYTLKAMIGNCEIVKTFVVTLKENNSFVIPNFVSINNDGRNDYWEIPEKYTNKEDVEVIIYSSAGKVLFRARNYQNNWPHENYSLVKTDPVVYYTISENDEITKKGSITIIE